MSAENDYFENPIQVDKGRLGKSEQGPNDIATPWRRPCILYAAGLGASEGPPACNLTHDRIWVFALSSAHLSHASQETSPYGDYIEKLYIEKLSIGTYMYIQVDLS